MSVDQVSPSKSVPELSVSLQCARWNQLGIPSQQSDDQTEVLLTFSPKGSMFERIVPLNKTASCGMMDSAPRRSDSPRVEISTAINGESQREIMLSVAQNHLRPSILMDPERSSTSLYRVLIIVLLPAPVLPTTAIFSALPMSKVKSLSTAGSSGR